jgi:hypothetical protein
MDVAVLHQVVVDGLNVILVYGITTFLFTKLLEVRHVGLFWALRILIPLLLQTVGYQALIILGFEQTLSVAIGLIIIAVCDFVLPVVFCKGKLTRVLFVALFIAIAASIPFNNAFFSLFSGVSISVDYAHYVEQCWTNPLAFVGSEILNAAIIGGIISLLHFVLKDNSHEADFLSE